uniref:CD109 molecule n=1 Tax=Poecilia mexicana TaxID=48701 RepID=A0A3B3WDK8_9TELE
STTLFLISGPEVLNAGSPTAIAITVFADFHGNLTAEVAHGNTKVTRKGEFQGGNTFPGSLSQNSLLSLTVRGYSENRLLFTNTTSLTYNLRTVSLFTQTDRSSYKPGDTVNVRVVTFQLDNKPYKGRVDISLGKPVESWNSTGNLGIVLKEFSLPLMSRPGRWMITATVNVRLKERNELPFVLPHVVVKNFSQKKKYIYIVFFHFDRGDVYLTEQTISNSSCYFYLQARFQTNEETLTVYTNYSSPTRSYIQIGPINTLPAQVNFKRILGYKICYKYDASFVVAAGTKNFSSSVTLTPELSWYPEACVTVYCIHSDGEITSDTAYISIHQYNHVTLNWSSERAQPGEQVSLTVAGSEPRFQVGITVTAMQNDALPSDLDYGVGQVGEEHFGLKKTTTFVCSQTYVALKRWSKTSFYLVVSFSDKNWTSGKITVPNGVTCLGAVAVSVSDNLGLVLQYKPLTISNDFSLSLAVPSHLIKGEEIVLEVNVVNHLEQETEFVLMDRRGASIINAQKITLGGHESASALFPIRPLVLGEMEISVDAVSAEASDGLVEKIWVKPEGVEQTFSHTLFLEVMPEKQDSSRSVTFSFPPNLVPGSQRAQVALVGDILALSIENLDSLVQLPTGCGEQNMVHFAPSVFVLQYLEKSSQDDAGIRNKALRYMMQGYEKQLSFQRDDGSFSAFGQSDSSGSTWLTALVLRYFLQAQPYMQIDQTVLTKATAWLLKHQDSRGEFTEVGKLIHTEMRGGLDDSPVALTAYVLLEMYADNVSLSLRYLESKVSSGIVSNYTLCLVAYALALGKSNVQERVITELTRRADYRGDSECLRSNSQQQHSAQIEMASYVLLVQFLRGSFLESIPLMKWLSMQRSHLGGFGTTQDTVVALQVLSYYAAFSGANAINLSVNISSPVSSTASLNHLYFSLSEFFVNIFYNTKSTQDIEPTTDKDAFILNFDLTYNDSNHIMLSASHTGMAIMEVGMLSGFSLFSGVAVQVDFIRRVDIGPERVSLYLDSVTKAEVCVTLPLVRTFKVAHVKDAVLQVYDYYEPTRKTTRTYNTGSLHTTDACSFCGENCDNCKPGITISVTSHLLSHSRSAASCSLALLCAGLIIFLVSV